MMIGHSGSGKTTYMAAMYGLMCGEGIEKYSIVSKTQSGHDSLANLCSSIFNGSYPKQTDIHSEYNFHLCYDEEGLIEFDWNDYRGGALSQRSDTSNEVRDLEERIVEADALIVFLDGDKIIKNDNYSLREYRRISQCINKAVNRISPDYPYPISFIITKAGKHTNINLYDTPGFKAVANITQLVQNSENIHGLLALTEVNDEVFYNVEYPFLFSMMFGIIRHRGKVVEAHEYHREKAQEHINDDSFLDRAFGFVSDIFDGDYETERELAQKEITNMEEMEGVFNKLTSHLEKIQVILKEAEEDRIDLF